MSMSKQLSVLIVTLVIVLFAGVTYVGVSNTRDYMVEQLTSHAHDAANSLSLSITSSDSEDDPVIIETLASAMFDGGFYQSVSVESLSGETWVDLTSDPNIGSVPAWFVSLFPLEAPKGEAEIMSGWRRVGRVFVQSHPGYAYQQLWDNSQQILTWFVFTSAAVLFLGVLALRFLLKPLKAVEAQADAICLRKFPIVEPLPRTLELRRVVEAMNRLAAKVKSMLSSAEELAADLKEQAYRDPVTGLFNKARFVSLLEHRIADSERFSGGFLFLLQLKNFREFNNQQGYFEGDALLKSCALRLSKLYEKQEKVTLARLNGADFAVLFEDVQPDELADQADRVMGAISDLYAAHPLASSDVGHLGAAFYQGQTYSELLAQADKALRDAQHAGPNRWSKQETALASPEKTRGASEWRDYLREMLETDQFLLAFQPVYALPEKDLLHFETLLRLPDPDDPSEIVSAGAFMPIAEASLMTSEVDKAVIERVLRVLDEESTWTLAVNLSPPSLASAEFRDSLIDLVSHHAEAAKRLIIEVPEYGASGHINPLKHLYRALEPHQVRFGLDNFGVGFGVLGLLQAIDFNYIKIEGSIVRGLSSHDEQLFFMRALAEIAHGLDLIVVAESVESQAVWDKLASIGCDGAQGHWLGKPKLKV